MALHFGHRVSIDIDLFTHETFDAESLRADIEKEFSVVESSSSNNSVTGVIEGVKVDFIAHQYALINDVARIDGLRLLNVEDIAAMKLNAIANRGSKKDFFDIFELLQHFSWDNLFKFYSLKYPSASLWVLEKSLTYFDDAEAEPNPGGLKGRTWEEVKTGILKRMRL